MRLSHDRWYSRDGQRQLQRRAYSQSSSFRKVISLSLLLALVIGLMMQLSDRDKYEPAFQAIGLAQTTQSKIRNNSDVTLEITNIRLPASLNLQAHDAEIDRCRQVWAKLMATADAEAINELAILELGDPPGASRIDGPTDEAAKFRFERLTSWLDETESRIADWPINAKKDQSINHVSNDEKLAVANDSQFHRDFAAEWKAWASFHRRRISPAAAALDETVRTGLRLALDQRLLDVIHDAEPWRPAERWALARSLRRADELRRELDKLQSKPAASKRLRAGLMVEVPVLLKQTKELRGRVVRFRGAPAAGGEPSQVEAPELPSPAYEIVWLRPDGANPQPVCVYCLKEAAPRGGWPNIRSINQPSVDGEASIESGDAPTLEVTGMLLKRMAYPSQRGIDVAPVLVAFAVDRLDDLEAQEVSSVEFDVKDFAVERWIEPGERERELVLLREIFASNLEALREAALSGTYTSKNIEQSDSSTDLSPVQQLAQNLGQLPRVEGSIRRVMSTEAEIGPGRFGVLRGWVHQAEPIDLLKTRDEEGKPIRVYRLQVLPSADSSAESPTWAFVNRIPSNWKASLELRQPVELPGIHLSYKVDEQATEFWIADRPIWSWRWSDCVVANQLKPAIAPAWLRLGAAGFDLGSSELIRKLAKQPMSAAESEPFYSLIDVASQSKVSDSQAGELAAQSAFDCLDEKTDRTLLFTKAKVHIIRATKIEVNNEAGIEALNGEHYFELDGLADIEGRSIRLKSPDGKSNVDFDAEYPITLVAKQLPTWLFADARSAMEESSKNKADNDSSGVWYPRKTAEIEGYFYRLWSYSTSQTRNAVDQSNPSAKRFLQNGPLIAVTAWKNYRDTPVPANDRSTTREIVMGIGIASICLYVFYRFQTKSRRSKRRKAA